MYDEALLQLVKSIDDRTARMETKMDTAIEAHDKRIGSLENSRTAARASIAALAIGGASAGTKMGLFDKIMSFFGGGT